VTSPRRIRLFLDSNVLTGGIVSAWGLDKATLSLCAAKVCKLLLAEVVRDEVEEDLLLHAAHLPSLDADQLIEDYRRLINLTSPELVPYPDKDLVHSSRHLIRYAADVPVLLSAMASKPDWLLTPNTKLVFGIPDMRRQNMHNLHFLQNLRRSYCLKVVTVAAGRQFRAVWEYFIGIAQLMGQRSCGLVELKSSSSAA